MGVKREIIYPWLHCHHQNDSRIKVGSGESHFNLSLIVRDKVTRQCPRTTAFEEKGEPKAIRTEVPLLTSLTPYRWAKPVHSTRVPLSRSLKTICMSKRLPLVGPSKDCPCTKCWPSGAYFYPAVLCIYLTPVFSFFLFFPGALSGVSVYCSL